MSTSPESGSPGFELDLDLHFLPAWAQKPPAENKYANYEGGDPDRRPRRGGGGGRPDDRGRDRGPQDRNRGPRRDGPRPSGPGGGPPRFGGGGGGRPEGRRFGQRPGGGRPPEERREPLPPPIEVQVSVIPEEKGVESLARQIRLTGRAYPLFDIAALVLKRPDRYYVRFQVIKKAEGKVAQPLFVCALDDSLWLSEQEAMEHVLSKHFGTFYQSEKIPSDPPKGTYTFVAQCGVTGTILGPPNYHDYQNKLRKLHAERFARMPFEAFKSRIKIVREEAVVKKWLEDQSFKTEYICLNVPETIKLNSREEVDKHFRETHLPNVIKSVESHTLAGPAAMSQPSRPVQNLARRAIDEQVRFPLKVVNVLSQQFAGHGLQFFKVNKTVTHVAVARPRYLDMGQTPVSDGIRNIVEFIENMPNTNRRKLFEALAPSASLQAAEGAPDAQNATPPTPEAAALVSDLHWLIHQGHVIEFANGGLELAKKPLPRPVKEPKAPASGESAAAAPAEGTAETAETAEAPVESGPAETQENTEAPAPAAEEAPVVAAAPEPEPAPAASEEPPKPVDPAQP